MLFHKISSCYKMSPNKTTHQSAFTVSYYYRVYDVYLFCWEVLSKAAGRIVKIKTRHDITLF